MQKLELTNHKAFIQYRTCSWILPSLNITFTFISIFHLLRDDLKVLLEVRIEVNKFYAFSLEHFQCVFLVSKVFVHLTQLKLPQFSQTYLKNLFG